MRKGIRFVMLGFVMAMSVVLGGCGKDAASANKNTVQSDADTKEEKTASDGNETKDRGPVEEFEVGDVLIDDENCYFKVTEAKETEEGYEFDVYMENRTDQDLAFATYDESVNGLMEDSGLFSLITPGSKVNEKFDFSKYKTYIDDQVKEICLDFRVYGGENFGDDIFYKRFSFHPTKDKDPVVYERKGQSGDKIIKETDDYVIMYTGMKPHGDYGQEMELYIVNKSDSLLDYNISNVFVNGVETNESGYGLIDPQKSRYSTFIWYNDDLAEAGIESIDEVTMELEVYNASEDPSECILEETISVDTK